MCDVNEQVLTEKVAAINAKDGGRAIGVVCDVRDYSQVCAVRDRAVDEFGKIDVMANFAGGTAVRMCKVDREKHPEFPDVPIDVYDWGIDVNLKGPFYFAHAVLSQMREQRSGLIINIGSISGDAAYPGGSVYCATKAAVKALSDGLRIDLVDTPLRVTNIKPGLVETNFSVVRFRGDKEKADNVYRGIKALSGDDIAEVVYFAASAPEHMQIAEVLVMPTYQATGTIVSKNK